MGKPEGEKQNRTWNSGKIFKKGKPAGGRKKTKQAIGKNI